MQRWWLIFVLATAPAVAWGQSAAQTQAAAGQVDAANRKVAALEKQRAALAERLQAKLAEIESLKQQKQSWARDRELNPKQAEGKDIADALGALDRQLAPARDAVAAARRAELAAIDAELAAGAAGARAAQLHKARAQLAASQKAPNKIAIPYSEIDPSSDADELEQQAAQLRATERQLATEAQSLDQEAKDLAEMAEVKKHSDRANELARRDDDVPHRANQTTGTNNAATTGFGGNKGGADQQPSPTTGTGMGSGSGAGGTSTQPPADHTGSELGGADRTSGTFESEAAIVLGDVVDHDTIESLARASRSGDPARRTDAARKTRDAVRAKLEQLQRKRALIEARAKQLRK